MYYKDDNRKKRKRTLCLLLCAAIMSGCLIGCSGKTVPDESAVSGTGVPDESTVSGTDVPESDAIGEQGPPAAEPLPTVQERVSAMPIDEIQKQELLHAASLGLSMEKLEQETISGKEMAQLLDEFMQYAAPGELSEWQKRYPKLRQSEAALARADAMAYWYLAAQTAGGDYLGYRMDGLNLQQAVNLNWDDMLVTVDFFGNWDDPYDGGQIGPIYLNAACYFYNLSRLSYFSGENSFPINREERCYPSDRSFTYAEALLAVVRLVSSAEPELFQYIPDETDAPYLAMADARRAEIRNTATDAAAGASGTVYYISNDGDDSNDGLSPETAWATPYRAVKAKPGFGDVLLFRRGDTWYIDVEGNTGNYNYHLTFGDGITIGAYGEGEKPILRGDIPEANNPDFWELYFEKDGAKIWKAACDVRDSAVIVFNEGESWATEVFPWMDGDMQYINPDGTPFVVEDALSKDNTFCNLLNLDCSLEQAVRRIDYRARGDLYLRCDAGNPAEVYEMVSVPQELMAVTLMPHSALSDLDLRYFTMMGADAQTFGTAPECYRYENLEIGWCGGWLQNYTAREFAGADTKYAPHIAGGGLGAYQTELSITGCYIHHTGPMATIISMHDFTAETPETITYENLRYSGNLFEYCGAPFHWADLCRMENPGSMGFLSNLVFEDNIVMNSGDGWVYDSILQGESGSCYWLSAVENDMGAADNDGILIRNNVFYRSRFALFTLNDFRWNSEETVNATPIFSGNTYVQHIGWPILQKHRGELFYPSEEVIKDVLGDKEGTLVILGVQQ